MSWSVGHFDILKYTKRWLVVKSEIVRLEVDFQQETLLKKLKSRCKQVPVSRCFVETFG